MRNINLEDICMRKELKRLVEEKKMGKSISFNFEPSEEILIDIIENYKVLTNAGTLDAEFISKKHPNILIEQGDISWFFNAFVNGEIIESFSPSDWKDKGSIDFYENKVEEYNKVRNEYAKKIMIKG